VAYQCILTGHAHPVSVAKHPGIGKTSTPQIRLALIYTLYLIYPCDHGGVSIDARGGGLYDLLLAAVPGRLNAGEKIALRLQSTVVVGVGQRIIQQSVKGFGVLILFCDAPGAFKGHNPGAARRRIDLVLRR